MFAIIESGGKQYKVEKDDVVEVEKLGKKEGATVEFKALLVSDGKVKHDIGKPYLKGKKIEGKVIDPAKKGKKIRIVKFKAKKRYRRTMGHRQKHTVVEITQI